MIHCTNLNSHCLCRYLAAYTVLNAILKYHRHSVLNYIQSARRSGLQPDTQGFHFRYPPKPAAAKTLTQAGHVAPRFWVLNYATQGG